MTRHYCFCILAGWFMTFVGCKPVVEETLPEPSQPVAYKTESSPGDTVHEFLTAMLRGEDAKTRSLLTPTARDAGKEIPFVPTKSKSASFRIDKTVLQEETAAQVHSMLIDRNEQGEKESAEIVWIVIRTEEGWRVAGAAVSLFEGQEKTVIDFEDLRAAQNAIAQAEAKEKQRLEESEIREAQSR